MPTLNASRRQFLATGAAAAATIPFSQLAAAQGAAWSVDDALLADIPKIMEDEVLPGLALAEVIDGAVARTEYFGLTSVVTKEPVSRHTLFQAASLSKPAFAYVVLKLAEQGRFDLDRPLARYLRPDDFPAHRWIDLITARHVLMHTSGLPNWRDGVGGDLTPAFEPGTDWRYSGEGFVWLQRVIESELGTGLAAFMRERLLDPAGMTRSTYGWTPERGIFETYGHRIDESGAPYVNPLQLRRELGTRYEAVAARWGTSIESWTYEDVTRALAEMPPHTNPRVADLSLETISLPGNVLPNAAGSLAAPVADYARFLALMMPQERPAEWQLSEAGRRAMLERRFTKNTPALGWGLGWGLEATAIGPIFYHTGNNGGIFRSLVLGDAARRRGLVLFANGERGNVVAQRIAARYTGLALIGIED